MCDDAFFGFTSLGNIFGTAAAANLFGSCGLTGDDYVVPRYGRRRYKSLRRSAGGVRGGLQSATQLLALRVFVPPSQSLAPEALAIGSI